MTEPLSPEVVHELAVMYAEDRELQHRTFHQRHCSNLAPGAHHQGCVEALIIQQPFWANALDGPVGVRESPLFWFYVPGDPEGQGHISHFNGHAVHSNGPALRRWRSGILAAGIAAARRQGYGGPLPIEGPVTVDRYYTLRRPKSVKRRQHTVKPDIDHLDRALFDALTGRDTKMKVGLIRDDNRILGGRHWKSYPGGHTLCPAEPGVNVYLYLVEEATS